MLRRRAFGWSGTAKAIDRLNAALAEVAAMARTVPVLAGGGAVLLLEKVSPAVCEIDSSSGALGSATHSLVETLVPIIAAAPVAAPLRQKWLDHLLAAYQEDEPPYIESLGMHWGSVYASPTLASRWADDLLPSVRGAIAERRRGVYAFSKVTTPCLSALFTAGRFDELEQRMRFANDTLASLKTTCRGSATRRRRRWLPMPASCEAEAARGRGSSAWAAAQKRP